MAEQPAQVAHPSFGEALRFWVQLGFINFGGPTGQIALMHHELVDRRRWVSDGRFLHALNYCMLLPGPEAQQLAVYVGWLLHGTGGGLVAGIFFIVPSFFLMLVLSWLAAAHGDVAWISAVFYGLGAAVVGLVAAAMIRVGTRALANRVLAAIAVASFVAILFVGVPFPVVIVVAGAAGWLGGRRWPVVFTGVGTAGDAVGGSAGGSVAVHDDDAATPEHARASVRRAVTVLVVGLAAWLVPLAVVASLDLGTGVFRDQAFFFSKAALVTFGGAYAVLAYINVAAVQTYGWVTSSQMVTGLGLAESTPGPLIMVVEFVGFLGAYAMHGDLTPLAAGALGATVVVWATFAPCFLWIFLGAPYIEMLRGNVRLTSTLSTITAAVVGVIGSLAVTFALTTLFTTTTETPVLNTVIPVPDLASIDLFATAIAVAAFLALWRFRVNVVAVVLIAAAAGLARSLL
ncbi:MAG: chromate efflux transporter [Actinomycetota bacterium]